MPASLDPQAKYPVVLDCDSHLPADSRPTFYARVQTMRGNQAIAETLDTVRDPDNGLSVGERFAMVAECLASVLVEWRNMGDHEFGASAMQDVLTYTEATELLSKVMWNAALKPEEKKS